MRRVVELSRYVVVLPALGALLGSLVLIVIGLWEIGTAIFKLVQFDVELKASIVSVLTAVDTLLLATVLLTFAVLLSTAISPMASGVVALGLFCITWVAGVVDGIGASLDNVAVARVGTVSRMLLPIDGLWRGAMHEFRDP